MGLPPVNCSREYAAGSRASMSALVRMVENRPSAAVFNAAGTRAAPPRPTVGTAARRIQHPINPIALLRSSTPQ